MQFLSQSGEKVLDTDVPIHRPQMELFCGHRKPRLPEEVTWVQHIIPEQR
jgi:hypothetical protein